MACNCNPFRQMIEANFKKAEKGRKVDPEKEYEKKLLDQEKEKQENEKILP